mmetsp:Transcript_156272/g.501407  ORF Transcript_156272/g.501407 Transcript_156272/m.501407 type:complete len:207 (-) Transcript_156272:959-1579(-)
MARRTAHSSTCLMMVRSSRVRGNCTGGRPAEQSEAGPRGCEGKSTVAWLAASGRSTNFCDSFLAVAVCPEVWRHSLCLTSHCACLKALWMLLPTSREWHKLCTKTRALTSSTVSERSTAMAWGTPASMKSEAGMQEWQEHSTTSCRLMSEGDVRRTPAGVACDAVAADAGSPRAAGDVSSASASRCWKSSRASKQRASPVSVSSNH